MNLNLLKTLVILFLFTNIMLAQKVILTKEEKQFLKTNPVITLGSDETWAPYLIKTDSNSITGYDNAILEKINELTGANFQLVVGEWKDMLKKAEKREIDGLSSSAIHPERKKFLNFSNPYTTTYKLLIVSSFNPKQIKSIDDLEGKTVAIQEGNLFNEKIAKNLKNINLIKVSSLDKLLDKLIKHEIDAIIEGEIFSYRANKNKIHYSKAVDIFEESKLDLVFSIRNDWPEALSILNKGLKAISKKERDEIKKKWFLNDFHIKEENSTNKQFSDDEIKYLSSINEITMCIDPDWMPFEKLENGQYIGMSADYFRLLEKEIKKPIRVIKTKSWLESLKIGEKRGCDIFSLVMKTPEREKYLNFTKPYLETPLVLVTRTDEIFVTDITKLSKVKIGIIEGYAYGELLRDKYPNLNLINVKTLNEGLEKVQQNDFFGFIGALAPVGYNIQRNYFGQLKITGKFDELWSLGIGTRNDIPILNSIFNKAIDNIKEEDHQKILNKWLSVKYEKVSYEYLYEVILISLIIILAILYVNRKLTHEINKRKKVEEYLSIIIKGANLGTWVWDPKKEKNIINDNWANMLGYSKEEVNRIGNPYKLIFKEDYPAIKKAFEEHDLEKKDLYEVTFRMKAKDGSTKWIYSSGSIVKRDITNKPILYAGIHQDITPKKELEKELIKQNEFILQQSRQAAMGEMLENIAHQWRQPLSLITTSASSVQIRKELHILDDKELDEAMSQIMKGSEFLSQTIEDFRNFFKKDKTLTEFTSKELFDNSLQFLKVRIISSNIHIIKEIEDVSLNSYKNELVQALINIINNAIDALEKNEKEKRYIFITLKTKKKDIIINIKDTAGGIKEDILSKIFDPYFTTKHQSQGTGIGLHMTKVIIEKHLKGIIEVDNINFNHNQNDYKGANFKLTLPKEIQGE